MNLFTSQTANGDSSIFSISNRGNTAIDNEYTLWVYGTWDGCSVTAHYSFDGTNWSATDTDATWTQNKAILITPGSNDIRIRLTLASAGASTSISAEIL